MTFLLLGLGLALLFLGGEGLVRGSVAVAQRLGVSPVVAGLILVGFGTSAPELVTSLDAALGGAPGISIGNVVGSNIANIFLILGITALLFPVAVNPAATRRDGAVMLAATAALIGIVVLGQLSRPAGIVLVVAVLVYVVYAYLSERAASAAGAASVYEDEVAEKTGPNLRLLAGAGIAVAGLVAVVVGADLLVDAAVALARAAGVSETIIGLTIVAFGTSLPELATAIVAGIRRHTEVAFGNVVGSNIFNILFILGVTGTVQPIPIPPEVVRFDIWVLTAATLLMLFFVRTNWRVSRLEGGILLSCYVLYLAVLTLWNLPSGA